MSGGAYRARDHPSDETQQGEYLSCACLSESMIRPPRGPFSFGEVELERNGGMNTADVSDARPSIGHKEGLRGIAAAIADGKQGTAASIQER